MHLRITEFKDMMAKAAQETGQQTPFTTEQMERFYKEQCLQQIVQDLELVIGHLSHNMDSMSPDNFFDNIAAIREFFGITQQSQGEIRAEQNSKGSDFDIDTEDKFTKAEKALLDKGILV